ncbi:Alpha/Beta hydrolase protein [Hyaloraphidium curvatum]|nr:Alpha/Beta hydrolase protein [Hyaloraphidium curvatum]
MASSASAPRPFRIVIEPEAVDDLLARLNNTRFPPDEPQLDEPWGMGVPVRVGREWVEEWKKFDFKGMERELNAVDGFVVDLPSLPHTHFFHAKSSSPNAKPLLLCHGWPQTSIEFLDIIPQLTDPSSAQPFHVVLPSIPGYFLSKTPQKQGVGIDTIARGWNVLMTEALGYDKYLVHGGDMGSFIARRLGQVAKDHVVGAHITLPIFPPPKPTQHPLAFLRLILSQILPAGWIYSEVETAEMAKLIRFAGHNMAYLEVQKTKPQTLGHSLADSPVGLLVWHLCIFHNWGEVPAGGDLPPHIPRKEILREVTATWLTNTGATSARMYWEGFGLSRAPPGEVWDILAQRTEVPVGVAWFIHEPSKSPKEWAKLYADVVHWTVIGSGGHFAGMENPTALVADIVAFEAVKEVRKRWGKGKL